MKVVRQGETCNVQSPKAEGGSFAKCNIEFQAYGGAYEDRFLAVMLGNNAHCRFQPGDLVLVKLRFQTHEHEGKSYQDITVMGIDKLNGM